MNTHFSNPADAERFVYSLDARGRDFADLLVTELVKRHSMKDRVTRCFVVDTIQERRRAAGIKTLQTPLYLMWKVTKACNLSCQHCWADLHGKERKTNELLAAVDRFADWGVVSLSISGGEPFLRKDLMQIIERAKKRRLILEIMTNGTMIDDARLDRLAELLSPRDDVVQVSMDGPSDEVLTVQRSRPIFDKVVATIGGLKERGIKVRVTFTATPINLKSMVETYTLVNDLGVEVFSVAPVFPIRRGSDLDTGMDEEIYLRNLLVCKLLENSYKAHFRWFLTRKMLPEIILNSSQELSLPTEEELVYDLDEGNISAVVDSAGELYPAAELSVESLSAGNIYETDIAELWERGQNWHEFRAGRDLRHTRCRNCTCFPLCQGGSKARAYHVYGTVNEADPTCHLSFEESFHDHRSYQAAVA